MDASKANALHVGITGSGAINGLMTGAPGGEVTWGSLIATRDKAESADLEKVMAGPWDSMARSFWI